MGYQEDENQVGELQPHCQAPLVQSGVGQEAGDVPGIPRVHELVHLLERNHTERFTALMDGFLPNWSVCRATLNSGVLGHQTWLY